MTTTRPAPGAVGGPGPWTGHWQLPEPLLAFDPVDPRQRAVNPLAGLAEFGPYSRTTRAGLQPRVRVALLAPDDDLPRLRGLLRELWYPQQPRERADYLPPYPGWQQVFGCPTGPADDRAQITLPAGLDSSVRATASPARTLAAALADGLQALKLVQDSFDVIVFYLPPRFAPYFTDGPFDLHDAVKAAAAQFGLSTQIITDEALRYRCRASVAWRLATALYAKAGWIPWKLDTRAGPLDQQAAYIGLSYALRPAPDGSTGFVTCCSQVFDADGGGMQFVAYDVGEGSDLRNPYLSQEQMRLVMARSLALYQDRHAGASPRRLVVHKQTPFTSDEVAGCTDAWGATSELTCVTLERPHWRGVQLAARNRPGYAVDRGTTLALDGHSALVWVAGNARTATLTGHGSFLQGKKGTPRPLLLTRHAGRGPLTDLAEQVLALSKMNWNNDALYDALPCTIRYAQTLAKTLKHMPGLLPVPYDYRLFM